jgi:hypothetical protein
MTLGHGKSKLRISSILSYYIISEHLSIKSHCMPRIPGEFFSPEQPQLQVTDSTIEVRPSVFQKERLTVRGHAVYLCETEPSEGAYYEHREEIDALMAQAEIVVLPVLPKVEQIFTSPEVLNSIAALVRAAMLEKGVTISDEQARELVLADEKLLFYRLVEEHARGLGKKVAMIGMDRDTQSNKQQHAAIDKVQSSLHSAIIKTGNRAALGAVVALILDQIQAAREKRGQSAGEESAPKPTKKAISRRTFLTGLAATAAATVGGAALMETAAKERRVGAQATVIDKAYAPFDTSSRDYAELQKARGIEYLAERKISKEGSLLVVGEMGSQAETKRYLNSPGLRAAKELLHTPADLVARGTVEVYTPQDNDWLMDAYDFT